MVIYFLVIKLELFKLKVFLKFLYIKSSCITGSCAFGLECNCLNDPSAEFLKMGQMVFQRQSNAFGKQLLMTICPDFARKCGVKSIREDVSEFYMKVVKDVTDHRAATKEVRPDFMNLLLQLKNSGEMTFNEIAAEAFVFIVAGIFKILLLFY